MDTITNELLRQTALWRVLTGHKTRRASEEMVDSAKAARSEETGAPAKTLQPETAASAETGGVSEDWAKLAQVLLRRESEFRKTAGSVTQGNTPEPVDVTVHSLTRTPETKAAADLEAAFSFPAGSWTVEPARELSFVFERDARRYDGGFSLY